jgi:ubiquinone/menaquinone biosynthesis C-methylase UbiE
MREEYMMDNKTYQQALAYYGIAGAHPGGHSLTKKMLKREYITKDTTVLDAGCGVGLTSSFVAKRYGAQVTAIDLLPEMVEKAHERVTSQQLPVTVMQASLDSLPFTDESFDLILAESVLTFTSVEKSLKELHRVLKKNGVILTIEMSGEESLTPNDRQRIQSVYGISHIYSEQQWAQLFKKTGFHSLQVLLRRTAWEEMLSGEGATSEAPPSITVGSHPVYDQVMAAHQQLLGFYGDRLGYRVFRSLK